MFLYLESRVKKLATILKASSILENKRQVAFWFVRISFTRLHNLKALGTSFFYFNIGNGMLIF